MAVKTFTTGEVLTASDTNTYLNNGGLVYVTSTAVGSGVSSVTVSNCFSSTYSRYKIVMSDVVFSASAVVAWLSLSGITSLQYYSSVMYQLATSATVNSGNVANSTAFYIGYTGNQHSVFELDNFGPNSAVGKTGTTRFSSYDNTESFGGTGTVWSTSSAATTGFSFFPASGTMTGGTITVYGYRKA